jgi:hypothetical protein
MPPQKLADVPVAVGFSHSSPQAIVRHSTTTNTPPHLMQNIDAALDAQDSALTSIQLAIHRQQKRLQMEEHLFKLMLQTVESESLDVGHKYEPQHPIVGQSRETQQEEEDQIEKRDGTKQQLKTAAKKTAARNAPRSSKRKR